MINSLQLLFFAMSLFLVFIMLPAVAQISPTVIFPSPLKQSEHELSPDQIICNEGLMLIKKLSDDSPACVQPTTAQNLVQRNWGVIINSNYNQQIPTFLNSIKVNNTDFTIHYNIIEGKMIGSNADISSHALIMFMTTIGNGELVVDLPRGLIDMQENGHDSNFNIKADGNVIHYLEINTTSTDRILAIPFNINIKQIEFIANPIP